VRYRADPELKQQIRTIEGVQVVYLALLRSKNPALEDVRVRKALSLGIDRDQVTRVQANAQAGDYLVPPMVPGRDETMSDPFDPVQAKQLLADSGYSDPSKLTVTLLASGGAGATPPMLQALADLWQKNLGIQVKIEQLEAGQYVERRWAIQDENTVGYYYGTFTTMPTWSSWLNVTWGPDFTKQFSLKAADWETYQAIQQDANIPAAEKTAKLVELLNEKASPEAMEFARLVDQATVETDPAKQLALFKQAAQVREETYLFIPVGYVSTNYAVKPTVEGLNLHPGLRPYYFKGISNG